MEFPPGKCFAFSILDDTDDSTVENLRPIYDLLTEIGWRTTKTVWPVDCPEGSRLYFAGETLGSAAQRSFVHELVGRGFEIAWHGATMESSRRSRTLEALRSFEREFGFVPQLHCNHGVNQENLYWGEKRYGTSMARAVMSLRVRLGQEAIFSGETPGSPYFWGDLCRRHFRYVRNFTFSELNLLRSDPHTPYRLDETPWVPYWFSTAEAPNVHAFRRLVTPRRVERLARESGVCILSTHLGKGFVKDGKVDPQVEATLRLIASLGGWCVPVSRVLDHLRQQGAGATLLPAQRRSLEWRHIRARMRASPW